MNAAGLPNIRYHGCTATGDALWTAFCAGSPRAPGRTSGRGGLRIDPDWRRCRRHRGSGTERRLEVRSGEVSIDGTLRLTVDAFPFVIEGMELNVEVLSLADAGRHAGKDDRRVSARLPPGEPSTGSALVDVALEEVTRTANTGG